ncbi:MAG: NYN domain-containing protein [Candidatus Rhabdochlamydia sp.]
MHYWIDGYNFFFRVNQGEGKVKGQEEMLLETLHEAQLLLGMEMTVVLDGKERNPAEPLLRNVASLRIVYTPFHQTADRYIIDMLECRIKRVQTTVVSSDKALLKLASENGARVQTIEAFIQMILRKQGKKHRLAQEKKAPSSPPSEMQRFLKIFEARLKKEINI